MNESYNSQNQVAIVGMSCLMPGAANLRQFYNNIINGVSSISTVDSDDWDYHKYYEKKSKDIDKIYCKRGGFISQNAYFDPIELNVMPKSVSGSDPEHFLALKLASQAIKDVITPIAPYQNKTNVILARNGAPGAGAINLIQHGQTLYQVEEILQTLKIPQTSLIMQNLKDSLNQCNSDTIPGVMPNIIAGRIANKFNFGGKTLIIDSACASSLIALELAINDIKLNNSDMAIVGGIHVNSFPFYYQMFCGIGALSHNENIRPFDNEADGTLLADGIGMVVIKRLNLAIKDKDRIYARILATSSGSSGHEVGLLAPSAQAEARVIQKAYALANIQPQSISFLEGHGTSTKAGDLAELKAIEMVYQGSDSIALSCIKSQIGHCQAASAMAGLIKTALCLYHKVLPPTINIKFR